MKVEPCQWPCGTRSEVYVSPGALNTNYGLVRVASIVGGVPSPREAWVAKAGNPQGEGTSPTVKSESKS